jgi:hypothetical protein
MMGAGLMTVYGVGAGSVGTWVQGAGVQSRLAGVGAMGLSPMSASTSPAQSNRTGLRSTGSTGVWFVGDGAGSMGMGLVCMVLASTVLVGSTVLSLRSGLMGETGVVPLRTVRTGSMATLLEMGLPGMGSTGAVLVCAA